MTVSHVHHKDSQFDGPVCYHSLRYRPRSCTDVVCGIIYLVFVVFMVIMGIVAFVFGSPLRLLYGHDSFGNICGTKNERIDNRALTGLDMTNKPYVFSFDISNPRDSLKICVARCPDRGLLSLDQLAQYARSGEKGASLCRYDLPASEYTKSDVVNVNISSEECAGLRRAATTVHIVQMYEDDGCLIRVNPWRDGGYGPCPRLPVNPSWPILKRCVPDRASEEAGVIYDFYAYLNSLDFFSQVMADLYASYREIVGLSLAALFLSSVYLGILYLTTPAIVYVILTLVSLGSVVGTALLWWAWASLKQSLDSRLFFGQYDVLEEETKNEIILLVFAICATVLTMILFVMLLLMRPKTDYVIRMFEEATICIRGVPWLLLQPLWTFFVLTVFFLAWCAVMLCLATSEIPRFVRRPILFDGYLGKLEIANTSFTAIEYDNKTPVRFVWVIYVVGLIWISEFILAGQQMVVAGAISMWYFERDKKKCCSPILAAIRQTVMYHMGSVALGSFLITVFKIPRLIVVKVRRLLGRHRSEDRTGQHSRFSIYDDFLAFINHNAYAIIAVQGTVDFMPAGAEARDLLHDKTLPMRHMLQINCVGDFILFLGKCSVTAIVAVLGIVSMKYDPQLHLYAIPLLVCCVFAYFIAHSVLSLYEVVIDTIFLCYCEDIRIDRECSQGIDVVDRGDRVFDDLFAWPSLREFMHSGILKIHPRNIDDPDSNT